MADGSQEVVQPPPGEAARREREVQALQESGIFDAEWYAAHNADVGHSGEDPHTHYINKGWKEGRAPNFYLDPAWYLQKHADVREAGVDPVLHYLLHGDFEGRAPGPHFDNAWYRTRHGLDSQERALAHFLRCRQLGVSPIPEFDAEFYLSTYRDVARAGADPFEHYVTIGWQEGREPHPEFESRYYVKRHMGGHATEAPLLHWLRHRHEPGVHPRMPQETPTIPREVKRNTRPAEEFEEPKPLPVGAKPRAKVLAYYLPQFHAIAENDRWWGTGFTEWTNLPRALPRFAGHYQPRIPRDLGHYTLTNTEVMRRQIALAKGGGVHGFVFYWYWFNGHRLLEKPLDAFLADRTLDMPFALMWANENWTRRWDGAEQDVLMSQDYRPEEEEALIATLARHFADPRYIRVQGRPVLMVYRAGLIPEPKEAIAGWRKRFRDSHGEDPVFVMAQSFDDIDPTKLGFDGAIEFPPHKLAKQSTPISGSLDYLDPDFTGTVFSFDDIVRISLEEPEPDFPLIKCAVPGWDNDPRKQGSNSVIIHGAKPASYQAWLSELVERAERKPFFGEPLVCVNAWNEWCEGAYLEPDLHYGAAFLNATARAVIGAPSADVPALLVAAADAQEDERTRRLLATMEAIRRRTGLRIEVLLLAGGPLEADFGRLGQVTVAANAMAAEAALTAAHSGGVRHALLTLGAAARLAAPAAAQGIASTVLLQEMPGEIRAGDLLPGLRALRHAAALLAPSEGVISAVAAEFGLPADLKAEVLEPGLPALPRLDAETRETVRAELGLEKDAKLLLGSGPGDLRHGFDLFLQLFRQLRRRDARLRAVWVGNVDPGLRTWMGAELAAATRDGLRLVEHLAEPGSLYAGADLFALTAREAAFPTVVQQALTAGLPVVAFRGAGGAAALAEQLGGRAVPPGDVEAMAEACLGLLATPADMAARTARRANAISRFDATAHAAALLARILPDLPDVAVAVRGLGLGRLLASRLDAVFRQELPVREVLLLDDAADPRVADGAAEAAARWQRELRLLPGPSIPGLVAAARAALAATKAEFLWLADAENAPGASFLGQAVSALAAEPAAAFAFASGIDADRTPSGAGCILWRRTALAGAVAKAGAQADLNDILDGLKGIGLSGVPLLRRPLPSTPVMAPEGGQETSAETALAVVGEAATHAPPRPESHRIAEASEPRQALSAIRPSMTKSSPRRQR